MYTGEYLLQRLFPKEGEQYRVRAVKACIMYSSE